MLMYIYCLLSQYNVDEPCRDIETIFIQIIRSIHNNDITSFSKI